MMVIGIAAIAAVLVAIVTGFVFRAEQRPVYEAQPMPSVRVGDPGHNLVGPDWSGLGRPGGSEGGAAQE
jgi:hypothetical protein